MNEDSKQQFISDTKTTKQNEQWIAGLFRSVIHAEEEFGKDLADMNADEVNKALASSDVISSITIANRIPFVVRYKHWCADHGFGALIISADELNVDLSDNIRDTMVATPASLSHALDMAMKPTNPDSAMYIYRAFLWMGFAGLYSDDAIKVRDSDVDFRQRRILFNNRWYMIPDEGIEDLKRAARIESFCRIDTESGKIRHFRRSEGDLIMRGQNPRNEALSDRQYVRSTLTYVIADRFTSAGYSGMSFNRIRKSGIFFRTLQSELKGFPVNFYEVGHDDYIHTGKVETAGQTKQKILRRTILSYEKDYEAWKIAFETALKEAFSVDKIPVSRK